jgi:hypothetical protein
VLWIEKAAAEPPHSKSSRNEGSLSTLDSCRQKKIASKGPRCSAINYGDLRIHQSTFPTIRQFLSRPIEIGL